MGNYDEKQKSKLLVKEALSTSEPFKIRSLDEIREVGNYTWIAEEITEEMGFPDCVKDGDDCHCCEGQLFIMRHGAKKTSQSKDSFGQVLTIINHETGSADIFTRALHPLLNGEEWTPWQMVATGDPKLITENNSINETLSTLRKQVENDSKRIETAENSLLASATVRFDRIEENESTIKSGEVDVLKEIVYYRPANKFVAADSSGNYWDTWDGMDAYMSGGKIREDKVYLHHDFFYIYNGNTLVCTTNENSIKINELSRDIILINEKMMSNDSIHTEKISDFESALTNEVYANYDNNEFSSEETKVHITDSYVKLGNNSGINPKIFSEKNAKVGHKYYLRIFITINGNYTKLDFGLPSNYISILNPLNGIEHKISGIITCESERCFYFVGRLSEAEKDAEILIRKDKGILIIDLTEQFGEGYEPTESTVESMITDIEGYRIGTFKKVALQSSIVRDNIIEIMDKLHMLTLEKKQELLKNSFSPKEYYGVYASYIRNPLKFYNDIDMVVDEATLKLRQAEIKSKWVGMMGQLPESNYQQEFKIIDTSPRQGYTFNVVQFEVLPNVTTTAYLLIPYPDIQNGRLVNGLRPAVVAPYYEPDTPSGIKKEDGYYGIFALEAVKRGYVALAMGEDPQSSGFYYPSKENPTIQPLHICSAWISNAINCLEKLQEVDSTKIGIIGQSYGGKYAMIGAVLDDRIACGVFGDYGCTFSRSNYEDEWYLGRITAEHPNGAYVDLQAENLDISELLLLMYPRKFQLSTGIYDTILSWEVLNYIKDAYTIAGKDDCVSLTTRTTHGFTRDALQKAFWMLDINLKK